MAGNGKKYSPAIPMLNCLLRLHVTVLRPGTGTGQGLELTTPVAPGELAAAHG